MNPFIKAGLRLVVETILLILVYQETGLATAGLLALMVIRIECIDLLYELKKEGKWTNTRNT